MNMQFSRSEQEAFTFIEILVVVLTLAILAGLLLPALNRPQHNRGRINCIGNLKQVGLAMRMFSNDHGDKFPWAVPKAEGGTVEFLNSPEVFRHFVAVSNELTTPKVLVCSYDLERQRASDWNFFSNTNLSYFAGLDADEAKPQTILSGDRNISTSATNISGLMIITSNSHLRVLPGWHYPGINIGLGDGSAQQMSDAQLRKWIQDINVTPIRLAIP